MFFGFFGEMVFFMTPNSLRKLELQNRVMTKGTWPSLIKRSDF